MKRTTTLRESGLIMNRLLMPKTFQVPNVLLDEVMPRISGSSLKGLLAIVRKTYGFQKQADKISFRQLEKLTDLSRDTINRAIKELGDILKVKPGIKGVPTLEGVSEYSLNLDISTGELAVANQDYLRTARRYMTGDRLPIYNACCLYGARFNEIANIFPVVAVGISSVRIQAANTAKCTELRELVQKGARINLIADAIKLPKAARHVCPANVSITPWDLLQLNPELTKFLTDGKEITMPGVIAMRVRVKNLDSITFVIPAERRTLVWPKQLKAIALYLPKFC